MLRKYFSLIFVALFGVVSLVGTGIARASSITYIANGTGSDGSLSASAAFTTSNGLLSVTLTDLLSATTIRSAGQALSDISFTLSNAPGTLGSTTSSGQLGNISGGVVTYTSGSPVRFLGQGPAPPNGSGTFSISGNTILMEAIGGGQPSQMILPSMTNGGTYTNANNGFDNFDPYTIGPATFTLALTGLTANTTITAATFSFGTSPDAFLPGTVLDTAPEPPSLLLLGSGIVCMAGMIHRRMKLA